MPTFKIRRTDNTTIDVEGRKFKASAGGAEFWFFVHESPEFIGQVTVSDVRTGLRVFNLAHQTLAAHRGDQMSAAKAAWKKFLVGRNQADIRKIMESAPNLAEAEASTKVW